MEFKAQLKFSRIAPRKVRLVCGLIQGMDIETAKDQLASLPNRASDIVLKVLNSAISNAKDKKAKNDLIIKSTFVNEGPTLKRWMPRAFGRASQILKRTSHITVVLGEREQKNKAIGKKKELLGNSKNSKIQIPKSKEKEKI